ncbi:MAG: hypothetical protein HGA90_04335 [Alphaproteobacteria bacterium]|nr:hypothetical protein [Alphaproteobacteria bacterium]
MSSISSLSNSSSYINLQKQLFSKLDTDSSGTLSKDEFVAGRPSDVSESKADALFSSLDSSQSGYLTETQLENMHPPSGQGGGFGGATLDASTLSALLQGQDSSSSSSQGGLDDMISAMDTDGDGTITKEEFVAARPSDASETQASSLFDSFDTESAGSLSTTDLKTAMAENAPPGGPPPPPPSSTADSSSSSDTDSLSNLLSLLESNSSTNTSSSSTTTSTSSSASALWQEILKAVQAAYASSANYATAANDTLLSSVSATA